MLNDDLISRAAAIEHMKSMAGCATCNSYNYVRCRACGWDDAMNIVEELPAVDAAPVVHGRWIYFNCVGNGRYRCSECFHWVDAGSDRNYCPNCGAKMDE